jgi:hypothetical protein
MAHFCIYRWQLGLLLLSLPRRFIPSGFCYLPSSCADQSVPYPVGQTGPCQLCRLPDKSFMLRSYTDE